MQHQEQPLPQERLRPQRLDMIYPGRYILEYGPAGETDYRALLCIKFDEP